MQNNNDIQVKRIKIFFQKGFNNSHLKEMEKMSFEKIFMNIAYYHPNRSDIGIWSSSHD